MRAIPGNARWTAENIRLTISIIRSKHYSAFSNLDLLEDYPPLSVTWLISMEDIYSYKSYLKKKKIFYSSD